MQQLSEDITSSVTCYWQVAAGCAKMLDMLLLRHCYDLFAPSESSQGNYSQGTLN